MPQNPLLISKSPTLSINPNLCPNRIQAKNSPKHRSPLALNPKPVVYDKAGSAMQAARKREPKQLGMVGALSVEQGLGV